MKNCGKILYVYTWAFPSTSLFILQLLLNTISIVNWIRSMKINSAFIKRFMLAVPVCVALRHRNSHSVKAKPYTNWAVLWPCVVWYGKAFAMVNNFLEKVRVLHGILNITSRTNRLKKDEEQDFIPALGAAFLRKEGLIFYRFKFSQNFLFYLLGTLSPKDAATSHYVSWVGLQTFLEAFKILSPADNL